MKREKSTSSFSRRNFLTTSAMIGAGLCASAVTGKSAAQETSSQSKPTGMNGIYLNGRRTLGTGKAAFEVSTLGFGCMGMSYNRGPHPDRNTCIRLLHEVVDRGVTLFDTAQSYGPFINEELVGDVLSQFKNRIHISTKFGHRFADGQPVKGKQDSTPVNIRRVAEDALRRLKIDTLALFYQHRFDPDVPIEDVAGTVGDLIREGKVRHFGLCEVSPDTIRRAHAVQPLTAIQSEYSLMWKLPEENGVLDVCEELGIGFVPYSPLGRGFLGGNINEYTRFYEEMDNRATLPRFTSEAIRKNTRLVEALHTFGRTRGITTAQISLAWLLAQKPWIVPIPGTTKLAHLEEDLRSVEIIFTNNDLHELNEALSKIEIAGNRYPPEQERLVGH